MKGLMDVAEAASAKAQAVATTGTWGQALAAGALAAVKSLMEDGQELSRAILQNKAGGVEFALKAWKAKLVEDWQRVARDSGLAESDPCLEYHVRLYLEEKFDQMVDDTYRERLYGFLNRL